MDNDPLVIAHARARMISSPIGKTACLRADLRDPAAILRNQDVRATLDFRQPVALLLIAVMHFVDDSSDPYRAVSRLVHSLAPGSSVALSHATFDLLPDRVADGLAALTAPGAGHGTFRARTRCEVARFVDRLETVEPGLVPIVDWRPNQEPRPWATGEQTSVYGVVARVR